ncbi:hypothetical protein CF149_02504 [Pseudomonas psychrophila]|nr:hypothetical protein CF149_02504 [Pseudomonas psychrophila]
MKRLARGFFVVASIDTQKFIIVFIWETGHRVGGLI